jgi:hypothetical protein
LTVHPFQHLPEPGQFSTLNDVVLYVRRLRDALLKARRGKLECVLEFTLATSGTTTVLKDERLSPQSVVVLDPKTAAAATELAAGTVYALTASRGVGEWTFNHSATASTRDYQVAIIG